MISQLVESFTGLITAIAALFGVSIAWTGLSTWKTQHKWNVDVDLAKRIMTAIDDHRLALQNARRPDRNLLELESALKSVHLPDDPNGRMYLEAKAVHQFRWQQISAARRTLSSLDFEAKVLWHKDWDVKFAPIWKLEGKLFQAIRNEVESKNGGHGEQVRQHMVEKSLQQLALLHFTDEESDEFFAEYEKALAPILRALQKRLDRK